MLELGDETFQKLNKTKSTLASTSAIFLFFFQNDLSHCKSSHPILLAYMCLYICAHTCMYLCVQMYRDDG